MNHLGPSWGDFGPILEPILVPKLGSCLVIFGVIFWTQFWALFGPLLAPVVEPNNIINHFGAPFWDQIGSGRRQDGTKRAIESFKDPKSCNCKNIEKPFVFQGFWGPEASQESLRRPKKAPKRHLKSSKTQQKTESKNGPQNYQIPDQFWDNVGVNFWDKKCSKRGPKIIQLLEAILEASWACLGAVLGSRVRAARQQPCGPRPGRGKGRAAKLIYSAYLAYLAA